MTMVIQLVKQCVKQAAERATCVDSSLKPIDNVCDEQRVTSSVCTAYNTEWVFLIQCRTSPGDRLVSGRTVISHI